MTEEQQTRVAEVFADLDTYERECHYQNWDGEDAWPVSPAIVAVVTVSEGADE